MSPYLTVIIPTYNRVERLRKCLEHIQLQTLNQDSFEVLVVNDGSEDGTTEFLNIQVETWSNLTVIHQKNTGQGLARNHALKHAKGQIILFIGDDIYGDLNFLEAHVNFHQSNPSVENACLGLTHWYSGLEVTPFMHWLTHGGPQFDYRNLVDGEETDFWHFYTSNISLKKELLEREYFDSDFKGYGWEDIELAYRLHKEHGMRIFYHSAAQAEHDDPMEFSQLKARMKQIAKNTHVFELKHPELPVNPKGRKYVIFWFIGTWPCIFLLKLLSIFLPPLKQYYWYASMKRYYLEGMEDIH